ncbi:BadF/BadG/BcrA/BcrD ATPase family protein [uncultured Pelagimonas sp.]|uniref:BadF/BadG/BcrA/BcrD ATPase family protein n=1 Tax=uncultured Pelagimonas sp. TaxID=1618102 RepID=UPI002628E804|nr:BadF/BadG/BcrA/BcrD ATPase family protein [uncultured Pelagimonas sp.]
MTRPPEILAIDGGGTRCRVACEVNGQRFQFESGSCNVTSDLDGSVTQIMRGLNGLAAEIGAEEADLLNIPCYLGLAGVTGAEKAQEVADRLPFQHVRIEEDRAPAARGALGRQDGALIHCGTGSFQAFQVDGHARFAGGWGARLGDEASAQWVGRLALSVTLEVQDGLHPASDLTRGLMDHFGNATEIVAFAATADAAAFGRLAPQVTKAAAEADPLAQAIMQRGADRLAFALAHLGWTSDMPVMLTGGIAPSFAPYFDAPLQAALTPANGTPIDGAISLAHDFRKEITG